MVNFFVISLVHSSDELTFWRSNDAGYTSDLNQAGVYSEKQIRENLNYYHNGDNISIPCDYFKTIIETQTKVYVSSGKNRSFIRKVKFLASRGELTHSDTIKKELTYYKLRCAEMEGMLKELSRKK